MMVVVVRVVNTIRKYLVVQCADIIMYTNTCTHAHFRSFSKSLILTLSSTTTPHGPAIPPPASMMTVTTSTPPTVSKM